MRILANYVLAYNEGVSCHESPSIIRQFRLPLHTHTGEVRKVSEIVANGYETELTLTTNYGYNSELGRIDPTGSVYTPQTRQTKLARRLQMPHRPSEPGRIGAWGCWSTLYVLFWAVNAYGAAGIIGLVIYSAETPSYWGQCSADCQSTVLVWVAIYLAFFVALTVGLVVLIARYRRLTRERKAQLAIELRKWEADCEKWGRAEKRWERLFYCFRDGIVYFPGTSNYVTPEEMTVNWLLDASPQK